jgi:hypothetical protein
MAPVLTTESGVPVPVPDEADARDKANQQFTAAMAASGTDSAPPQKAATTPAEPGTPPRRKRGRPPKAEQARTAPKAAPETLTSAQRHQGVQGLAQLGAGVCLMVNRATGNEAYRADAIVIANNAEAIAGACAQSAEVSPAFARTLDKVCAAGPHVALVSVMVAIASQITRNHNEALELPGTVSRASLLASIAEPEQEPQAA